MIGRPLWRALIGCGLLVMIFQDASPSQALDFSNDVLVYHEDFEGEITVPTSPEVNLLLAGDTSTIGVDGNSIGFVGMGISGGVALGSIHSEVPPAVQNFNVPSTFSSSFGIRATFNSFSLGLDPADGQGTAGVVAAFGPLVGSVPVATVSAGVVITRSSGSTTGFVIVRYFESTSVPLGTTFIALSAGATSAILGGTPLTVDLAFDKTAMIATASANIAGVGDFMAPPLDVSGVATITSSTPLVATNLFAQEHIGLDFDVNAEDILVFRPVTLIGDQVLIEQFTSIGALASDQVTAVAGSPEVTCPGPSDLCNSLFGESLILSNGIYDIEAMSLSVNAGIGGGSTSFSSLGPNGYRFLGLFSGQPITAISLATDIPGLTSADVSFTSDSVSVNLAGLVMSPGQSFLVELNPPPTPAVPVFSGWGALVFAATLLTFAWRQVDRRTT